ncbi:MAG: class I SAM-dependent methyltransferase [Bacteroidales bacterium]|jgi:SAM-dependent methyltransferase|nr:class I SAM-dependent methyltransferase [Bacteroidales bacterium]
MSEITVCPVCQATSTADLYRAKDHLVSGREFLIRQCAACGMAWTVEPPAEEEAGKYYVSDEYISHTDIRQSLADRLYHLARRFMLKRKGNLMDSAVRKSTGVMLDIGSGTGYFAAFMQKRGWQVTGIELSEQARSYSVKRFGIKAIGPQQVRDLPSAHADCITFWHVLEHLYDPAGWLGEVRRILKDDGRCIIALPNFASPDAKWFGKRWAALDVPRHLWHFTPDAFRQFAAKQGFVCERTSALPLDLFYISSLSYRNAGIRLPLARGVLTGVVIALRSLFRRESASSLVYVLSKKDS